MRKYITDEGEKDIKKRCNTEALSIVDMLYDKDIFNDKLTRKSLRVIEEILSNEMSRTIIGSMKSTDLLNDIEVKD